jgi:hypothetical protein
MAGRTMSVDEGRPTVAAGLGRTGDSIRGCPWLVWGIFCQGGAPRVLSIFLYLRVSLFDLKQPFPRPDPHGSNCRRAQERSRMAR